MRFCANSKSRRKMYSALTEGKSFVAKIVQYTSYLVHQFVHRMLRGWLTSSVLKTLSQHFGVLRSIHTTCVQWSARVWTEHPRWPAVLVCTVNVVYSVNFFVKFNYVPKISSMDRLSLNTAHQHSQRSRAVPKKTSSCDIFLPTPLLFTLCPQYTQPVLWDG